MTASGQNEGRLAVLMFTDIVGSLELQEQLGTFAYTRLVGWHDELFHKCLRTTDDVEILNETGDGFLVRFRTPSDAVLAALRLQYLLAKSSFESQSLRVRVGIHLGVVTEMFEKLRGERRVVGMPINIAGRVMGLAEGGQILMTHAIHDDARHHVREHPSLPADFPGEIFPPVRWMAHGFYHFKGGREAIEIFEVGAEGIGPLRAPAASDKFWPSAIETATGQPVAAPPPPALAIEKSDIYLSYAPIDDCSVHAGHQGWISQFHRNLEVRLKQLTGDDVAVYRDQATDDSPPAEKIIRTLPEMKAMVSVISPPFAKSERCRREMEAFLSVARADHPSLKLPAGMSRVNRLLSAIKSPVLSNHLPPLLHDLMGQRTPFEFFERDPVTGRYREFDDTLGEIERRRYQERIYDLAYELCDVIRDKSGEEVPGNSSAAPENGRQVYLAEVTSDLQEEYAGVRRELREQGFVVVPDKPLPTEASQLTQVVRSYLAKCDYAVHLIGVNYGVIPENEHVSVAELQNKLAADRARESKLPRLIWLPRLLTTQDSRQREFIRHLNEDAEAQEGSEVIQATLSSFKELLQTRLRPKQPARPEPAPAATKSSGQVYLICDRSDEAAIEPLEDYLFEQGLDLCLPDFEADQEEMSRLHRANLKDCDAVLIYYGQAHKAWVDIQLRDALKAPGYGRPQPIPCQAVYIAPPPDRRKERYRSHAATILMQPGEVFAETPELKAFVASLNPPTT